MAVRFYFQEMLNEIDAFAGIAANFIASGSKGVLPRFRGELELYRNAATRAAFDWEIPDAEPLTTIATNEYEPGGGGSRALVAQISAKWQIKRDPPPKKSMPAQTFLIVGKASTRVRIRCIGPDQKPSDQIAMWRMEIADKMAPGCFFHSQILGESDQPPFPRSLPVPRFPTIAMTPASIAEFTFGEFFQDRWGPESALRVPHQTRWAPIQRDRFRRVLGWKLGVLDGTSGSPWPSLKSAQPNEDLFI